MAESKWQMADRQNELIMSPLWKGLETLGSNWAVVPAVWRRHIGDDMNRVSRTLLTRTARRSSWVPSRHLCGCKLRVVQHSAEHIVGISDCETPGCSDVRLAPEDLVILELSMMKVARAIANALGCDVLDSDAGVAGVRQIATFGDASVPILFAVPRSQTECGNLIRQLIDVFGGNFIVLTPTSRFLDGMAQSALRKVNAAIIALESFLTVGDDGVLRSNRTAAELFASLTPRRLTNAVASVPTSATSSYVFERAGSSWRVVFDGPEFHIEDTLGARYLNYLFRHPNEPVSAFDLEIAITPEKANARERNSMQSKLDSETVRQYLRELNRLRAERDEAVEEVNHGEVERLNQEISVIEAALKKGGNSADAGERARGNVRKAVASVRKKLLSGDKSQKAFGEHIGTFVSTGYECVYNQVLGRIWLGLNG